MPTSEWGCVVAKGETPHVIEVPIEDLKKIIDAICCQISPQFCSGNAEFGLEDAEELVSEWLEEAEANNG